MAAPALLCALAVALAHGCGGDDGEGTTPPPPADRPASSLEIRVWLEGRPGRASMGSLDCAEPESEQCSLIRRFGPDDFAPTPADLACTQIYGGPEEAEIAGTLDGEEVNATFSRANECEIERRRLVTPLLESVEPRVPGGEG